MVLTSSGCASGCASDHLPHSKSTFNLGRSVPSLHSTLVRPGYTHLATLPSIRSVSGQTQLEQSVNIRERRAEFLRRSIK